MNFTNRKSKHGEAKGRSLLHPPAQNGARSASGGYTPINTENGILSSSLLRLVRIVSAAVPVAR